MVTRMGFEPMNVCVKGICVNRFTNAPFRKQEAVEGIEPSLNSFADLFIYQK